MIKKENCEKLNLLKPREIFPGLPENLPRVRESFPVPWESLFGSITNLSTARTNRDKKMKGPGNLFQPKNLGFKENCSIIAAWKGFSFPAA